MSRATNTGRKKTTMGNRKDALRGLGIMASEVSGSRLIRVPHTALMHAPPGHWAHDPRSLYEPDAEMVRDMIARFEAKEPNANTLPIYVWGEPVDANGDEGPGAKLLLVGDGAQRTNAVRAAFGALRARRVLGASEHLMVQVEFHVGDDRARFLEERLRRNDPLRMRRPDTGTVIAFRVAQLVALGRSHAEIAAACPPAVTVGVVEALERWQDVAASVRKKIDAGEVPIGLLPEILRHPKAEQEAVAVKLAAEGVKTAKGATRRRNKAKNADDPWARRMSPKKLVKVADALTDENGAPVANRKISDAARYVAAGMRIAAGVNVESVLDDLPAAIVGIIQEARAAKGVRS